MKHYFIFTVIALAISFATGCKKDDSTPETTKKETIPHKENIAYYKTDVNDVSAYKVLVDQTVAEYNILLGAVDKLPQYPKDKYKYAGQDYAWAEGKRISNELLQNYNNKKSNIDVALAKKTYEDLYQYGVVYAHIELMARQSEVYRKEYPTNAEIENLIKATFDGLYTTQEGNDHFIKSTNEEIVTNYNKIIDIVNKLKSQQ